MKPMMDGGETRERGGDVEQKIESEDMGAW